MQSRDVSTSRVAFVTGAASGIGLATARKFLLMGWSVSLLDIDERVHSVCVDSFPASRICAFKGDVRSSLDQQRAVDTTMERFGRIDCVFANAGIHLVKNVLELSGDDLTLLLDTNVRGVVYTLQKSIPKLIAGGGGTIILMSSNQSQVGRPEEFGYGLTKGAIAQMTKSLALDLAPHNIRVNSVCPGTIHTPLSEAAISTFALSTSKSNEDAWSLIKKKIPLRRVGTPEEVANAVYFLASAESSYITGSLLTIDGGVSAA